MRAREHDQIPWTGRTWPSRADVRTDETPVERVAIAALLIVCFAALLLSGVMS